MDTKNLKPGEIVLLAAGAVGLIASFLPWYEVFGQTRSAWSSDAAFPVSAFVPLSATVAAALFAVRKFTSASLPSQIVGFTVAQLEKAFAFFGLLLAIGWVIANDNAGFGFWISVLCTIAAVVGVVMIEKDSSTPVA